MTERGATASLPQPDPLPADLPRPIDDGSTRHVPGRAVPALTLPATDGTDVTLDRVTAGRWVLFIYPSTHAPGAALPPGWNEIPGARGCSAEACGFRDNLAALREAGAERVLALSADPTDYQQSLVQRFHLPYPLLSDPNLALAAALRLPTFEADGRTLYKRLTMVVDGSTITHVFYPIFPPDRHATEVVAWLRTHPRVTPGLDASGA